MIGFIWFIIFIELLLIASGPILIAVDISLLSAWLRAFGGDFYTILTLAGLISIWSLFGLTAILYKSKRGLKIYVYGLTTLLSVQCIISFIHGILLFQYQPLLFDLCLEKQTIEVFWWPLGGTQNNPMMKKVNDACGLEWHRFAKQRIVTLCVYNVILLFCLYVVTVFYHHQCQARPIEEERQIDHPLDEKFVAEMYRQRQKIFDEIEKRREARKSIQRRGSLNQPPRHFSPPFHRRALDADGEIIMNGMPTKPPPIYQDEDTSDAHHDATPLLQPDATPSQPSTSCLLQPNASHNSQESFTTAETNAEEEETIQQDKVET